MRNMRYFLLLMIVVSLGLAGCASQGPWGKKYTKGTPPAAATQTQAGQPASIEQRQGARLGSTFKGNPLDNPASPLSQRVFYFDFDSSRIKPEYLSVIAAHGRYLADHPNLSVMVEGNTDERGSREYNMALGQQRAQAVAKLLMLQGADTGQIQVISYGEERPVALGHNEAAWRLNRRVELHYSGQ